MIIKTTYKNIAGGAPFGGKDDLWLTIYCKILILIQSKITFVLSEVKVLRQKNNTYDHHYTIRWLLLVRIVVKNFCTSKMANRKITAKTTG